MTLLERDEQLTALDGYLGEAADGHGRLVFIAGEAGVGKSSFVAQAVRQSGSRARIAVGGCDGSATPAPLGPLVEMLPDLPDGLWPDDAGRQDVFGRLLSELRTVDVTPYLLVIEDLHWADEATLDLVRFLARRIHTCRALVLATYRPEDAPAGLGLRLLLGDTASATGTRRIDLPVLTATAVATLIERQAGFDPATPRLDARQLHEVTGGNAFFVTEALSAGTGQVPPTVRDAVMARVSRLGEDAQRALEVVALAGARAEAGLLGDLLAHGLPAIDEPLDRGLVQRVDDDVVFRHELARLAVAEAVPIGRGTHLHRRLLAALEARGADPARLAHHAEQAHDRDAVLRHAPVAAARAAALGAHREAVRQYRRALRHADGLDDGARADLFWALGYECYLTSRIDEAIEATEHAREIWDRQGERVRVGDAWRCLSRLSWFAGRNEVAEDQGRVAFELLDGTHTVELARALSNRAQLRMLASDLGGTQELARRTLELVDTLPVSPERDEVRTHALNNLGTMEITAGDLGAGTALLRESLELARGTDLQEHAARAYCNLVSSAVLQRRHGEARRYVDEGIDYCVDRDLDAWTQYLQGWRSRLLLDQGQVAEARAAAEAVLLRADLAAVGALEPRVVLAHVHARAGSPDAATHLARAAALAEGMREIQRVAPTTAARCEAAWMAGDEETGARLALEAWPTAQAADCPWNRGSIATWLAADVEVDLGSLAPPYALERAGDWEGAAEVWRQVGSPFEQALALARSGRKESLSEAVRCFERVGAEAAADRARILLRTRGWSVPRTTSAARHPDGLTARETEVHALLREGLSDAEIAERLVISRRTAEHHVASILAKTGASSRRSFVVRSTQT